MNIHYITMFTLIIVIAPYGNLRKPHKFIISVTIPTSYHTTSYTIPFTDNPHPPTPSLVSDLQCCSVSDITAIQSSPISLSLTSNTLNVALPVMITVDITNTYSSVRCGQFNNTQ